MCIGVPMQVVTIDGFTAQCAGRDGVQVIDISLAADAQPGDWVMVFLGAASIGDSAVRKATFQGGAFRPCRRSSLIHQSPFSR